MCTIFRQLFGRPLIKYRFVMKDLCRSPRQRPVIQRGIFPHVPVSNGSFQELPQQLKLNSALTLPQMPCKNVNNVTCVSLGFQRDLKSHPRFLSSLLLLFPKFLRWFPTGLRALGVPF